MNKIIENIMLIQHVPKIILAIKVLPKYKANTVNILNKKPNPPNAKVYFNKVILPFKFSNCFFHSEGICF